MQKDPSKSNAVTPKYGPTATITEPSVVAKFTELLEKIKANQIAKEKGEPMDTSIPDTVTPTETGFSFKLKFGNIKIVQEMPENPQPDMAYVVKSNCEISRTPTSIKLPRNYRVVDSMPENPDPNTSYFVMPQSALDTTQQVEDMSKIKTTF